MDGTQRPSNSAVDDLLDMQQQFLSQVAGTPLLSSPVPQSAPDAGGIPETQPSPLRAVQDPMLSSGGHSEEGAHVLGLPFRQEAQHQVPSVSAPLFHQPSAVIPASNNVVPQTQPPEPTTVAPNEVQPLTLNPSSVFPSDLTTATEMPHTSGRRLPGHHDIFAPPQHIPIDAASDITNESVDEASEADGAARAVYPTEVKEYMVTLPFSASRRPLYDDIILQARPDIEEFCQVFHNGILRTPKPSSIHKIEKLFLKLLDICDLPPELDTRVLKRLSPKEVQKYAFESNSKYAFIWELLHLIRNHPMKVLIVARSEKILFLLENLVLAEHYAYSRTGLQDMKYAHAQWPVNIVLSQPNQPLAEGTSDFDLIIGFDYEFKRSNVASRLNDFTSPETKQPMVLQLVLTHSIEHLDLSITERDPDMPSLDHKNAIVLGMTKLRRLILNPDTGHEIPHEIAARFAHQLMYYSEDFFWEPIALPDEILSFYVDSSQSVETESLQSKKRKLDDAESIASKRRRISRTLGPMVNAERIEALSPIIRCLGPEVLDKEDLKHETSFNEQGAVLQELRALVKELRKANEDLETQNDGYAKAVQAIEKDHLLTVEERGKFHREKDAALLEVKRLSERLLALEETKSMLAKEVTQLKSALPPKEPSEPAPTGTTDAPAPTSTSINTGTVQEETVSNPGDEQLKKAQAEIQKLAKKVESAERDLDYTRQAYQNASQSASDLGNENRELSAKIRELEHKASDNLRQIHQINLETQVGRLAKLNDEQAATLREREWELDRLRDEVRVLKAARRETRQASVPRSPHMGMMSPRTAGRAVVGAGGPTSRGSSPASAVDTTGMQMFGQQPGNGRWGHLRD
ncbi:hypothetical protein jhhlp_006558 [Lomentospora prolificans]|uniref:HDA1 complex subunit n=1 Tax=Lomentospora prolificans TaxID=41688 RepID=A0A2N3N693_9PEZI|nr:hypothetical protein jhhlp_006558 [Lomentospora prolificans]